MMLPKKIHYIWFGHNPYPLLVKKCLHSWEKFLPDYELMLWNEHNSPINHPYVKKALKQKQWAFAADYVRFYALYHHGGIYLDTDMEIIKGLDSMLQHDFFLGRESHRYLSGGIIGARAQHPALLKIMRAFDTQNNFVILPEILTRHLTGKEIYCYPEVFFYPYNPYDEQRKGTGLMFCDITDKTYGIHHWNKSWQLDKKPFWKKWLKRND